MSSEVIASQENDWKKVVAWLTGPVPQGRSIFYQKHMSHHLLPEMSRDWLPKLTHCFLIRHPSEVLPSLDEKYERPRLPDTGYPQQVEIFDYIKQITGLVSPIVEARDILSNPKVVLMKLCEKLGVDFGEEMMTWEPGPRDTDGVWARHWYNAVEKTAGFQPYSPKNKPLPDYLRTLYEQCLPYYEKLHALRINPL
jgi:hypothetical protein